MSFTLQRHIWDIPKLSHVEFRILACFAHHADNTTFLAYPSVRTVAKECQCSISTVQRALNRLLARRDNVIFTTNRAGGRCATTYQMFFPGMEKAEKKQSSVISFEKKRRERGPTTKKLAADLKQQTGRIDTLFQEVQG